MGQELIVLGSFNDVAIHARPSDQYVDVTELCQTHGRHWWKYVETSSAKRFVAALSNNLRIAEENLVVEMSTTGRRGRPHKFAHRQVALHCAAWISAEFEVWVYGKIEELLTNGRATIGPEPTPAVNAELVAAIQAIAQSQLAIMEGQRQMQAVMMQFIASLRSDSGPQQRPLDYVDPREHIRKRFPGACQKTVGKVVRCMNSIYLQRLGRPAPQMSPQPNAPLVVEREHLWVLDRAIEKHIDRLLPEHASPLFQGRRTNTIGTFERQ